MNKYEFFRKLSFHFFNEVLFWKIINFRHVPLYLKVAYMTWYVIMIDNNYQN